MARPVAAWRLGRPGPGPAPGPPPGHRPPSPPPLPPPSPLSGRAAGSPGTACPSPHHPQRSGGRLRPVSAVPVGDPRPVPDQAGVE
ncbi:hypothetical protein C3Y87_05730 [Carbonactinospora thermoautotrophica]|nr:hypothetical protein [Carbonactinospora thermoautotrophica]